MVATVIGWLPRAFRERFAEALMESVADGLAERRGFRRLGFLIRSVAGIVRVGLRERFDPSLDTPVREPRGGGGVHDLVGQELRLAARALARRPSFTALVVGTLALGIGATTAVFSVVDGVLLRPLPYADPDGLVMVWAHDSRSAPERGSMSVPDIASFRDLPGIERAEGWTVGTFTLTGAGDPVRISGARTTGSLLSVLGGRPALGRDLRPEENSPDAPRVVVLGHAFWVERYGADPDVIGTTLDLGEVPHEIVGVMPEGFEYPSNAQLWVPHRTDPEDCGRGCHTMRAVARLAPGVTLAAASAAARALGPTLGESYPDTNRFKAFHVEPLMDYAVGDVRTGLWVLLGAVGAVLLIACANVANLLLVRASTRTSEVAVRTALGAGPRRMFVGILAESALLAAAGAVGGIALAVLAVQAFHQVPPGTVPRMDGVAVDGGVLLFALAVTVAVTLSFGLAPALGLVRTPAGRALGGGARGGSRHEARSRSLLLAGEVALSVVLLSGAGLFLRSLAELRNVDMGFDRTELVRFGLALPSARYADLDRISDFYRRLEERLRGVPGVEAVGSSWDPPLGRGRIYGDLRVFGRPEPEPGQETAASIRPMTPGFLDALGVPLLRGRGVEATDVESTEGVAVVNESFVRENFPGEDPLGERFRISANFGWQPEGGFRIVGVVADVRREPDDDPVSAVYVPHAQFGPESLTVHVRGRAGVAEIATAARSIVAELDPNVPVTSVETFEQALGEATSTTSFYLALVAAFAGLAVLLTGVGLFGVVSYLVSRRTREIGVRVALGAGTTRVRSMVVAQGLVPALWGVALGVGATVLVGRTLEGLLFSVRPTDPGVLAGVVALLLVLTVAATLFPARRATRVDPVTALRAE